jgi:hypothetical protein
MSNFARPKSRIKGVSDVRRLPRLGKIRLGVKAISRKTGKEYPKETEWFVVPPEVEKIYGPAPTELDVMFPLNEVEAIFPQRYIWYGQSKGAKCIGDGEKANRVTDSGIQEIECPCEKLGKECQQRAHLMVLLPKVSLGGVYQIDLGSYHSIVDLNSGLDYIQAMVGRFAMVPLKLKRVPKETHGSGKKETHYPLMIILEGDINFINSLRESTNRILTSAQYLLPAPIIENPAMDTEAVTLVENEEPEEKPKKSLEQEIAESNPESKLKPCEPEMVTNIEEFKKTFGEKEIEVEVEAGPIDNNLSLGFVKDITKKLDMPPSDMESDLLEKLKKEIGMLKTQREVINWMTNTARQYKDELGREKYLLLMEEANKRIQAVQKVKGEKK